MEENKGKEEKKEGRQGKIKEKYKLGKYQGTRGGKRRGK